MTASSQLDENSAPYNALSTDKGKWCFELLHTYSLEKYISLDTSFLSIGTFFCYILNFFLDLYLAIDTVFSHFGIIQNGTENFFNITCLKMDEYHGEIGYSILTFFVLYKLTH